MSTETKTPTAPAAPPKSLMRTCTCRVHVDKGWDVPKSEVTPAEALLLTSDRAAQLNGKVITDIVEDAGVERTADQEVSRLIGIYGEHKVRALFSGAIPTLPETFAQALEVGARTKLPQSGLGSFVVKK